MVRISAALLSVLAAGPSRAEVVDAAAAGELDVHAFVSQGFMISTDNNYLAQTERGSLEFTEVGLNVTKSVTERLRIGMQLFARDLGPIGNYDAHFDWFYLDYRFADWFGIRAGRIKIPFGLYNEINDIDAARVPILLPQSIYPTESRDFLLAQTGGEIYGYFTLGWAGGLEYRLYGGTIFLDVPDQPRSPVEALNFENPYVVGGRLLFDLFFGLRAGGSLQALRLDTDLLYDPAVWLPMQMAGELPADFAGIVSAEIPVVLWAGSLEYSYYDLLLAAEYSRWWVKLESSEIALVPESEVTSERMYGMAAYRLNKWFSPGVYYSLYFPDVEDREGRAQQQHDVAATARFDINRYWLLKLEGHYMHGTAVLNPTLNDNVARDDLEDDWALFLLKTTAYF